MVKNKKPGSKQRTVSARARSQHITKKHHRKPYRRRHVGLLIIALVVSLSSVLQLGVIIGRASVEPPSISDAQPNDAANQLAAVRSAKGFSFGYDSAIFDVSATEVTNDGKTRAVQTDDALREGRPLVSVTIQPKAGTVPSGAAATTLSIVFPDKAKHYEDLRKRDKSATDLELAATIFPVSSNSDFKVTQLSSSEETVGNHTVLKRVFEHVPTFGSGKGIIYSVQWSGLSDRQPFSVHMEGLTGSADIPADYRSLFDTLSFTGGAEVLGASTVGLGFTRVEAEEPLGEKYIADAISPAIVKIYHVKCGNLMVEGRRFGNEGCHMSSGTGFFVSSEGHIATNGHVVVFDAEDAFIQMLLAQPKLMTEFLRGFGLNEQQIQSLDERPDLLASIIAEIYSLPEDMLSFSNERQTYLVSLGDRPVTFNTTDDLRGADSFKETGSIKRAKFIAADYSARDLYVVGSGSKQGFSSSDVALLKVDIKDSPMVKLVGSAVAQNEKITIIGFPSDAENQLVDKSSLDVTVTNGNISSIRQAAGGKYTLYQSDADASRGNSGGPAINEAGEALGLLTYRFKNDATVDAAKSYIRDIEDLKQLIDENGVHLNTDSKTQAAWENGLRLFADNRFSKAVAEFEKVEDLYPAHRLADSYIDSAKAAIKAGKDIKDSPLIIFAIGLMIGLAAAAGAVVLIAKHGGRHQIFKLFDAVKPQPAVQPGPNASVPEAGAVVKPQDAHAPVTSKPPTRPPLVQ